MQKMQINMAETNKRQWHIELLRAICILLVIYNHSDANGMYIFKAGESGFVFYTVLSSLCKIAVPIFFMISGAVLLGREESVREVLKRVLKYVMIIVMASVVMYFHRCDNWEFMDFVNRFMHDEINGRYWFLYEYIIFLVSLPILRLTVSNMKAEHYEYLFIVCFVFSLFLPTLGNMIPEFPVFREGIDVAGWIGYYFAPIVGFYVFKFLPENRINGKVLFILLTLAIVSLALNVIMVSIQFEREGFVNENYLATWCAGIEVFVVYLFRWLWEKKKPGKLIQALCIWGGSVSFGIYIIEQYVEDYLNFVLIWLQKNTNYYIGSVIFVCVTFVVAGMVVWFFHLIKRSVVLAVKEHVAKRD